MLSMRSRRSRRSRALAGAAALISVALAGPIAAGQNSPAVAAGSSCGTLSNYLAVTESAYTTSNFGIRADIETNDPALCSSSGGSPSLSTAWAMLTPNQAYHWAQAGYIRVGTDNTGYPGAVGFHYVAQYTKACQPNCSGNGYTTVVTGSPGTATHTYASYLRASDDRIHMTVDGTNLLTVGYDVTGVWVNSWAGQFGGETYHAQSDIPGTTGDRTRFNYIQKYGSGGAINFISTLNMVGSPPSRYHRDTGAAGVGGLFLDVWTNPL